MYEHTCMHGLCSNILYFSLHLFAFKVKLHNHGNVRKHSEYVITQCLYCTYKLYKISRMDSEKKKKCVRIVDMTTLSLQSSNATC